MDTNEIIGVERRRMLPAQSTPTEPAELTVRPHQRLVVTHRSADGALRPWIGRVQSIERLPAGHVVFLQYAEERAPVEHNLLLHLSDQDSGIADVIMDRVTQRLQRGEQPSLDETAALLAVARRLADDVQRTAALAERAQIVENVYHRLLDEHTALQRTHTDSLAACEAERRRDRAVVIQAQIDEQAYHTLAVAHDALLATHTELLAAIQRGGLNITVSSGTTASGPWGYQWPGEARSDGFPSFTAAIEAALQRCAVHMRSGDDEQRDTTRDPAGRPP